MKRLEHSVYHSLLRITAGTLALTLLFVSGALTPVTKELTFTTEQYLASVVGASAAVAPTELNTITAALTVQQAGLDERAAALRERELALGLSVSEANRSFWQAEYTTMINSVLLFVVLVLMVLNYTLDFAHRRQQLPQRAVHNNAVT